MGDSCVAGVECEAPSSGTRIYPFCLYWLLENPFSLDIYLAQLRCSRESLGPSPKQCALPSLRSGVWGKVEKMVEEEGAGSGTGM